MECILYFQDSSPHRAFCVKSYVLAAEMHFLMSEPRFLAKTSALNKQGLEHPLVHAVA